MEYTLTQKELNLEVLKDDKYIQEQFEKYKTSEEYNTYTEMVKVDKPTLSPYLIELCLFGFFYEELRKTMSEEQLEKYNSFFDLAETNNYPKPEIVTEYKGVKTYKNEEEYLKENPDVKPIKTTIENPFTAYDSETSKVIDFKDLK